MTKKEKKERTVIDVYSQAKKFDKETIIKIFDIILKSKTKGEMIFDLFILLIIVSAIIYIIHYFF